MILGSDKAARGCTGKSIEVKECNDCAPVWTKWSSWSSCSASCGDRSSRFRKRICVLKYTKYPSHKCKGESFESEDCKVPACPSWGLWGKWGSCSKTCGRDSIQSRSRNCLFKGVATSANSCPGNPNEHRNCGKQGCAVWSQWSEWGLCSGWKINLIHAITLKSKNLVGMEKMGQYLPTCYFQRGQELEYNFPGRGGPIGFARRGCNSRKI